MFVNDLLFWWIACSDIHTRKYSGGHNTFVKMTNNVGAGKKKKKKKTVRKE